MFCNYIPPSGDARAMKTMRLNRHRNNVGDECERKQGEKEKKDIDELLIPISGDAKTTKKRGINGDVKYDKEICRDNKTPYQNIEI